MQPYYEEQNITIYHGDCRDILPHLQPVDHVITDPPYSDATHNGARTHAKEGKPDPNGRRHLIGNAERLVTFDSISLEELRDAYALCAPRRWLISFCEWRYIRSLEEQPPRGLRFVRFGVWVKPNGAPQFTGDRPGTGWEAIGIWHAANGRLRWNGGGKLAGWSHNITFSGPANHPSVHPTTKPLNLVKVLVSDFTDPGDLILDPFAGSGTTARACKDLGRRCILIEREEKYCEVAARRLSQEVMDLAV